MYVACFEDLFRNDEKKANGIKLCAKGDLLCSKLKFISKKSEDFCSRIGFPVNENQDFMEMIDEIYFNNTIK